MILDHVGEGGVKPFSKNGGGGDGGQKKIIEESLNKNREYVINVIKDGSQQWRSQDFFMGGANPIF